MEGLLYSLYVVIGFYLLCGIRVYVRLTFFEVSIDSFYQADLFVVLDGSNWMVVDWKSTRSKSQHNCRESQPQWNMVVRDFSCIAMGPVAE